ncbi:bile acid:sodium symporter family protein [soil metagenome]
MGIDEIHLKFNQNNLWALNLCLAFIMFGVALELKIDDFKRIAESPKASLVGLSSQFILLPFVTYLLVIVIQPQASIALGMMLVAACPGGNISNFLTHLSKGNTALSVTLTAIGTVLAIFMTPFNLELWASMYEPTSTLLKEIQLNAYDLFQSILLLAGIPLTVGMYFAHYLPALAAKVSKAVKPLSIIIFLGFVILAFSNNFNHFLSHIHMVVFIVFIHNAFALLTGYLSAKTFRLSLADQKSVTIETGIQNSGLGLFLIFSFFNGMGGMAFVAAWWGIWHIISGLILATYWSGKTTVQPA